MARKRTTRHRLRIKIFSIAAVLTASACGAETAPSSAGSSDGLTKIRVGWALTDSAPLLLGAEEGVFERNGLDIEMTETATTDLVGSVLSKKTDFGANTGSGMVLAIGKGIPITATCGVTTFNQGAEGSSGSLLLVKKGSRITKPADLEGKVVGVNLLSSASEFAVREIVDGAGGDDERTKIVEVPFASMGDAITNGDVDAAEVAEPFVSQLMATGKFDAPVGDPIEDVFGDAPRIVMTALTEYAEANSDVVKRFCKGVAESLALAEEQPDALHPIYEEFYKASPELAKTQALNEFKTELTPDSFTKINEIYVKYGAIEAPIPGDKVVA